MRLPAREEGLWEAKGHTDPGVLDLSIELDDLLNEYQRRIVFKGDLRGERGARGKKKGSIFCELKC